MRRARSSSRSWPRSLVAPVARAWTWPVGGPVLQPFVFDPAHPYAAGEHRGIDIGARRGGRCVRPAAGTVTFAGTVPSSGRELTITTPDGFAVTLTHLGAIAVAEGAAVAEGTAVGDDRAERRRPRSPSRTSISACGVAAEAQGYLDPARPPARTRCAAGQPDPGPRRHPPPRRCRAPAPVAAPAAPSAPAGRSSRGSAPVSGLRRRRSEPGGGRARPAVSGAVAADSQPASARGGLTVRGAAPKRASVVHETGPRVERPLPRIIETPRHGGLEAGRSGPVGSAF